jgi:hypothetical protein
VREIKIQKIEHWRKSRADVHRATVPVLIEELAYRAELQPCVYRPIENILLCDRVPNADLVRHYANELDIEIVDEISELELISRSQIFRIAAELVHCRDFASLLECKKRLQHELDSLGVHNGLTARFL